MVFDVISVRVTLTATPMLVGTVVRVLIIVGMPLWASKYHDGSSPQVLADRHRFEMTRIAAQWDAAQVVNRQIED
nr:hypothetical protein [Nocardia sp. BMG51109]